MATFRARFPTRRELLFVFAACAFPVYSWSLVAFFDKLPSWLLFLKAWDLVGVFGYGQSIALMESLLLLAAIVVLAVILPRRFFADRFVAEGSMVALCTALWAVALQINVDMVSSLSPKVLLLWLSLYFVPIAALWVSIRRFKRVELVFSTLADRLVVLLYVYLPLTAIGIVVVVVRNVVGGA